MTTQRTVLITGASRGIGAATAALFHNRGWNVAATMRDPDHTPFMRCDARCRVYKLDVTQPASIDEAIAAALSDFGTIDVLINNAALCRLGPFEPQTDVEVRTQLETNVLGTMRVTRAVLPHMRVRRSGRIINVSSICGRMTLPLYSVYCATKWAIEGFSEALSFELRQHNIKVKLVEPAVFRTGSFAAQREALAARVADPAYQDFCARVLRHMIPWEERAPGPDAVAQTILKAATDRLPRLRYPVRSQLILGARTVMPGALYVRAVRRLLDAW